MSTIKGFDQFVRSMNNASAKIQQETKEILEYNLGEMETMAISLAPGGGDLIKVQGGAIRQDQIADKRRGTFVPISQAIGYSIDSSGYKGSLYVERSAGDIAAYVEFGTGQSAATYLATVPKEWRDLAKNWYVDGTGRILAQPYILPSFMKYKLEFIKELKAMLKTIKL